jgi:hypothetical protein
LVSSCACATATLISSVAAKAVAAIELRQSMAVLLVVATERGGAEVGAVRAQKSVVLETLMPAGCVSALSLTSIRPANGSLKGYTGCTSGRKGRNDRITTEIVQVIAP